MMQAIWKRTGEIVTVEGALSDGKIAVETLGDSAWPYLSVLRAARQPDPAAEEGMMDTLELDDEALRARLRSLGIEDNTPYELASLIDIFIDADKLRVPEAETPERRKRRD